MVTLFSFAAVITVGTQCFSPLGALRDDANNGCEGDYGHLGGGEERCKQHY